MKEIIIKVNGMVCEGCENRVQNALKNLKGVKNVVANHNLGTVTILVKDEKIIDEIKEKIRSLDFEVID